MQANILSVLGVKKPVVSTFSTANAAQFSGKPTAQSSTEVWTRPAGTPRAYVLPQLRFGQNDFPSERLPSVGRLPKDIALIKTLEAQTGHALDPFQKEGIHALAEGKSPVVCAPTSSGKTLVAEAAIVDALQSGKKLFYTTPRKAISNEKYHEFCARYGAENVGLITGDVSVNPGAPLVLMTTEILRNLLYQPERNKEQLQKLKYMVFDECHFINDQDRGLVWEEAMLYARKYLPNAQQVHLSATVQNAQEYTDWLNSMNHAHTQAGQFELISSSQRPVPLIQQYLGPKGLVTILDGDGQVTAGFKEAFREAMQASRRPEPYTRDRRSGRAPNADAVARPRSDRRASFNPIETIAVLQKRRQLPLIEFVFNRHECQRHAERVCNSNLQLTTGDEKKRIRHIIQKYVEVYPSLADRPILSFLEKGVGYHHADMWAREKELVEVLLKEGLLKAVFATSTLAEGVNVPAHTVGLSSYGPASHPVSESAYQQMTGRAGRRGMFSEGYAVLSHPADGDMGKVLGLVRSQPNPVQSTMRITPYMTLNLLERLKQPERINQLLKQSFSAYQAGAGQQLGKRRKSQNEAVERLKQNFEAMRRYLQEAGFVSANLELTPLGRMAAQVPMESGLLVAKALKTKEIDWEALTPVEFAATLSATMTNELPKPIIWHSADSKRQRIGAVLRQLASLRAELERQARRHELSPDMMLETAYVGTIASWCETHDASLLDDKPGVMCYTILRTANLMRQISEMEGLSDTIRLKAQEARDLLIAGIVEEQIRPKKVVID